MRRIVPSIPESRWGNGLGLFLMRALEEKTIWQSRFRSIAPPLLPLEYAARAFRGMCTIIDFLTGDLFLTGKSGNPVCRITSFRVPV